MKKCNFSEVSKDFTSDTKKFGIAWDLYQEYHEEEDLRVGQAAFIGTDKDYGLDVDTMVEEEQVRTLMEQHSAGSDNTISWQVNGKGSLPAKIRSITKQLNGMWRLATDKGVALFKEGEVQSEPKDGKFIVVPAMLFTNPVMREKSLYNASLQEGDTISVFAQVGMQDGSHVTLNFNPEGKFSEGPRIPEGLEGKGAINVIKIGEFKSKDMEYDVVELEVAGKRFKAQPDGTPYHITRYVNSEKGIKPFMTGQHARSGEFTKVTEVTLGEGKVQTIQGTYAERMDRSGYVLKEGTVFAHVSDIDSISFAASAGDLLANGDVATWLGTHIGTYDVVKDYKNQMYKDAKEVYVYDVTLNKDLNALMLPDTGVDWNADTMYESLVKVHPEVNWDKDWTNEEVKAKLLGLGYDAVVYANSQEGRKTGKGDSIIILDKDVVTVGKASPNVSNVFTEYMDTLGVVHGNTNKANEKNWSGLEEKEGYKHGNADDMVELLDTIRSNSVNPANQETYENLKGLLQKLRPEFFEKVRLYMKKTTGESAGRVKMFERKIELALSKNKPVRNNAQSDEEVYVHEVLHTMIMFALRSKLPEAEKIKRELRFVMDRMRKTTDWKMFLNRKDSSINKELEELKAKEMWDYVFNSDNALDEFIVHVLTNPSIMEKAKIIKVQEKAESSTILEKVMNFFNTLVDVVLGNYTFKEKNKDVYTQVYDLAFTLATINTKAGQKIAEKKDLGQTTMDILNDADEKLYEKIHAFSEKYFSDTSKLAPLKDGASKIEKAAYYTKFVGKAMVNPHYAEAMGLLTSSLGMGPNSTVRTWIRDIKESDSATQTAEWLSLASSKIDGARYNTILAVKNNVLSSFKAPLSEEKEHALTRALIDTDVAELIKDSKWDNKKLKKLLESDEELDKEYKNAIRTLAEVGKDREHWYINQAVGLGYYMATGKAGIAQNFNARNIAIGYLSGTYNKADKKIINAINTVATLNALRYTSRKNKLIVADLFNTESKGVWNLLHLYNGAKQQSDELLFENGTHKIKGYSKEVFDDSILTRVVKMSEREAVEKEGFKFVKLVNSANIDTNASQMGLFVSDSFMQNEWLVGGTRLTGFGRKGTTITESKYAEGSKFSKYEADAVIEKLHIKRRSIVREMEKGRYKHKDEDMQLVPVLDTEGKVVDYRYIMDKEGKEELLKQDTRVSEVMGRTFGSIVDKSQSKEHNKKVLEVILKDMDENWAGGKLGKGSLQEWSEIGPNVADKAMKELYAILPEEFKAAANKRKSKSIAVPTELLHIYFGYRHWSIGNLGAVQKWLPRYVKGLLTIAESIWIEAMKIAKTNILLKIPAVLIGNIVSNFLFGVANGINPVTLLKAYFESFRTVREYIKLHRELDSLKAKKAATSPRNKAGLDKISKEIDVIAKTLESSSMHELYQAGLYTAIVEDVEKSELRSTNKLKKKMDEKLKNMWKPAKVAMQWAYLSEETKWYKVNQEVLIMSDLIARHTQNERAKLLEKKEVDGQKNLPIWWKEMTKSKTAKKRLTGEERKRFLAESKKRRMYALLNDYINYNKPSSKAETYLDRIGPIKFTKYVKRIQRVISNTSIKHPIKSLLTLLAQRYVYDVPSIQDSSVLSKNWYTDGYGPGNIVPIYSPYDDLMNLIIPPGYSLVKNTIS